MRVAFGDLRGNGTERGRSKRLAYGNPGAIWTRCEAGLLRGTYEQCRGVSTDQTHISVVTDEVLTVGLKSWSRGQKSQAASAICSGGVSAVMGSSDLDAHTLGSGGASGNQLSCSLPSGANRSIVEPTYLALGPLRCTSCVRTARPDPRLVLRP